MTVENPSANGEVKCAWFNQSAGVSTKEMGYFRAEMLEADDGNLGSFGPGDDD